jgi:HEAT repeat protein
MANGSFDNLFQTCVAETGAAYITARDQLLAMGNAIVPQLQQLASESDWRTATTAQILLGWLTERPLFEEAMMSSGPTPPADMPGRPITGERSATGRANVLASYGEEIVPLLIEIVTKSDAGEEESEEAAESDQSEDGDQFQAALLALDYLADPRAVMPLIDLAERTESPGLQLYALAVLGTIGDERAADLAQRVFADRAKGASVRGAAAVALGQLHATSSTSTLLAAARDPNESVVIRENAARALGYMGDATSGRALASLLEEPQAERLSLAVVAALNNIGGQDAIAALERASRTAANATVRRAAEDAHGNLLA